jgi:hypothetical protein
MASDWQRDGGRCAGGADGDLPGGVLYGALDLELADMTKDEALKLAAFMLGIVLGSFTIGMLAAIGAYTLGVYAGVVR